MLQTKSVGGRLSEKRGDAGNLTPLFSVFKSGPQHDRAGTIRAQLVRVAFGQCLHQLVVKVIEPRGDGGRDALVVDLTAAINLVLQPVVQVEAAAAFVDLRRVVELDLGNQQSR